MDGTLLNGRTIIKISEKKGFKNRLLKILKSDVAAYKKSVEIAKLLKCSTLQEFLKIFRDIPLQKHAEYVIKELKNKGLKTALITDSYDIAAEDLGQRLDIDYIFSNKLITEKDHLTGEMLLCNKTLIQKFEDCEIHSICKGDILSRLCEKLGIAHSEVIAVGDSSVDICMLRKAGLGIAFNAPEEVRKNADVNTSDLREILNYT